MTGHELRQRRRDMGMSQCELSANLGRSVRMLSAWECGRRTIPSYITLALSAIEAWHGVQLELFTET